MRGHSVDFTRHYEILRARAVEPSGTWGDGLGFAAVVRAGLTAWMRLWPQGERATDEVPLVDVARAAPTPNVPNSDVVRVLVAMALGAGQEVRL